MPLGGDDEEEDEEAGYKSEAEQIRAVSRASSVILGSSSNDEEPSGGRRSRRGYSTGPSVITVYCPYVGCSGAITGFSRRANLKRHLTVIHGKDGDIESEDEDEIDEVHGAVHVDGFLKPIRPQKGWRAGDTQPSSSRRERRSRKARDATPRRQLFSDDGYYADMAGDDMNRAGDDGEYI